MARLEEDIIHYLAERPAGATLSEIEDMLRGRNVVTNPGNVEAVMLLSDKLYEQNGRWRRRVNSKAEALREALATYSASTNRPVFRLESALAEMPIDLRPTVDELPSIMTQFNDFELMKNNMVRRKR